MGFHGRDLELGHLHPEHPALLLGNGFALRVSGVGFKMQKLGLRVQGLGYRDQGVDLGVQVLGSRVKGVGCMV